MATNRLPQTLHETILECDRRLKNMGPGPFSGEQQREVEKLQRLLKKCRGEAGIMTSLGAMQQTSSAPGLPNRPGSAGSQLGVSRLRQSDASATSSPTLQQQRPSSASTASPQALLNSSASQQSLANASGEASSSGVLDRQRLEELCHEIDPLTQLEPDAQEILLHLADDFIDQTIDRACQLAKHRGANSLNTNDVSLVLEKQWDIWVPGYTSSRSQQPVQKPQASEAHKTRMALIRRASRR